MEYIRTCPEPNRMFSSLTWDEMGAARGGATLVTDAWILSKG